MSYTIRPADLERDRDSLLEVWCRNIHWWTPEEHKRRISWYLENPYAPTRMFTAVHGPSDQVVGTIGLAPRAISDCGRLRVAGCVVDIAVDIQHRTVLPAMLLARAVAACLSEQIPLIWTQPNQESLGVFRRAGFRDEGECKTYVKLLRPVFKMQRHVRAPLKRWISSADAVFRSCYKQVLASHPVSSVLLSSQSRALKSLLLRSDLCSVLNFHRTPEFLHWAYECSPYRDYVLLGVAERDGVELLSCALCYRMGSHRATVDDLVYRPVQDSVKKALLAAIEWAQLEGCIDITLTVSNPEPFLKGALENLGFVAQPWRPLMVLRHNTLSTEFRICG